MIMARLNDRLLEVTRAIQQRLATEIAELRDDSGLLELLGASVEGNVDTVFKALRYEIPIENVEPPTAALEYSRRMAQRGVPMNALVRAYRLGHEMVLDFAREEIKNAGLDPGMSLAAFERMTTVTLPVTSTWNIRQVVVAYEQERDRWLENRKSWGAVRVREVLECHRRRPGRDHVGDPVPDAARPIRTWCCGGQRTPVAAMNWLRWRVLCASPPNPLPPNRVRPSVAADRVSGWGWIPLQSGRPHPAVADVRRFVARYDGPSAVALGVLLPGARIGGSAHRTGRRSGRATWRSPLDLLLFLSPRRAIPVRRLLLCSATLDDAREWVHEVLGPLASDTDNDRRLCDMLRVFLRHGSS